jgi:filamentous hemagglutinin
MYNYIELLCKTVVNGETYYDFNIGGRQYRLTSQESINCVKLSSNSNVTVVGNKYLRMKKGVLSEHEIVTTLVTKNGYSYINPLAEIIMDDRKFTDYLLNLSHEVGKYKAVLFNNVLGYNKTNYRQLMKAIKKGLQDYPISGIEASAHGVKYGVDMRIEGTKGVSIVITGWIELVEGKIRFVTAYIPKKRRS